MKMRRCRYCGWWYEPKSPRQSYCDAECKHESQLELWRKGYHRRKEEAKKPEEKKPSILKADISRLPTPMLPPTKEYRGTTMADRKLQSMFEMMERRRQFDSL